MKLRSMIILLVFALLFSGNVFAAGHGGAGEAVFAVAEIEPFEEGGPTGTAFFVEIDGKVYVVVRAAGLTNPLHGIHIHEIGDLSTPAASGGHFDPDGHSHAHPGEEAHAGDLLNLVVDSDGVGLMSMVKEDITLSAGPRSVAGRAIVIHAEADEYTPDNIGGARLAGGIIQVLH